MDTDKQNTMAWWILQYEEADMERRRLRQIISDMQVNLNQLRVEIEGLQTINASVMSSVRTLSQMNNELTMRLQEGQFSE
jgi:uncharacterized protein YlxW (UPF0749 family)